MKPRVMSPMKITRPLAQGAVQRERLFQVLERSAEKPILWITSPGGSGKTTLMASFLEARRWPCVWFQCDEGDSDLPSFYYYLGQGVRNVFPRLREALPLLTAEYALGVASFNKHFFERLFGLLSRRSPAQKPHFLVFDNYQNIARDSHLHDLLMDGLEGIPEGLRVAIISRNEPDASHMRWLANGRMSILGYDDLRFTLDESRAFITGRQPFLNEEQLRCIHERSEGWAAGIVLMMERGRLDTPSGPELEAGNADGRIFSYFAGEIFDKQSTEIQTFLLRTAFLPVLAPELVEPLIGGGRANELLSELHARNFFTDRLVGREPVFKYHALFRAFLVNLVKAKYTFAQVTGLQVEAALILEGSGHLEEAARLFKDAGDFQCLIRMIKSHAPELLRQGRNKVVEDWAEGVPDEWMAKDPWLQYWVGMSFLPLDMPHARRHLERAFSLFLKAEDSDGSHTAWAGILDAYAYELNDWSRLDGCIEAFEELQRNARKPLSRNIELLAASRMLIALILRRTDDPERIQQWKVRAEALLEEEPSEPIRMEVTFFLSVYHLWKGEYRKNHLLLEKASASFLGKRSPVFIRIRIGMMRGIHAWVTADYEAARAALNEGMSLAKESGVHIFDGLMWSFLVAAELASGRLEEARKALMNQTRAALATGRNLDLYFLHSNTAWLQLLQGNPMAADDSMDAIAGMTQRMGNPYYTALWSLGMAQVALQRGESKHAKALLGQVHQVSRSIRSEVLEWYCLLLQAWLQLEEGDRDQGLQRLQKALRLGKKNGYFHLEFYQPSWMQGLCAAALANGIEVEYVKEVILKLNLAPPDCSDRAFPPFSGEAWPYPIKIYTLGRFEIIRHGMPVVFTGKVQKKPLDMLKAMIAFGGKEVPEDELADLLWPEAAGDLAQKSLETTLGRLRKLLGDEEAVRHGHSRLSLDPGRCWVDLFALDAQLRAARQKVGGALDDPCKQAMTLHHGSFLPSDDHLDWVVSKRETLRSDLMRVIISIGRHHEQLGDWEHAIDYFEHGLAIDRLAEVVYRHVMNCCRAMGDHAGVVRTYQRCCTELRKGLGIEPSKETMAIYQSMQRFPRN